MHVSKLALCCCFALMPVPASADSPAAQPALSSNCTFTVTFAPAAPPAPGEASTIAATGTQQYPVSSYSLKPSARVAGSGVATVIADSDLISTISALKDQHAIMSRAAFACPNRSATLVNATVAMLKTVAHAGDDTPFTFTLAYGRPPRPSHPAP